MIELICFSFSTICKWASEREMAGILDGMEAWVGSGGGDIGGREGGGGWVSGSFNFGFYEFELNC